MTKNSFAKPLSANDIGATGSHQAGIHVPKSDRELLSFFPELDPALLNPDAWIVCTDDAGIEWNLRYIYYNNKIHTEHGTRNEYRLTHLTNFFRRANATAGDLLILTVTSTPRRYRISIARKGEGLGEKPTATGVIKLSGWRRIH